MASTRRSPHSDTTKTIPKLPSKPVRVGMVSLGCPKTLVDSEVILGKLDPSVYELVTSGESCDVALLNTCAFIEDAQKESVDKILEMIELKKRKKIKALIVMGCLVQRFPENLQQELKEVDAFIGSGDYAKIPEIVSGVTHGEKAVSVGEPGYLSTAKEVRIALTPKHYRYLKISEGCDHICTFCPIPSFRGKHRSRRLDDVTREARQLLENGARELIITGQDTTYYGRDFDGNFLLPQLIRDLDHLPGKYWLRLLYAYPSCVTDELINAMRDARHLCRYLDMPLQHASDSMLTAMKRGITKRRTSDLIRKFRERVPDLAIRTTFIVGFPGETEADFEQLLGFLEEMRFERLGVFTYSQEEGTAAAKLPGQIPEKIKRERFERAMALQQKISAENMSRFVGKKMEVLVEGMVKGQPERFKARSYMDAPDIDGFVFIQTENRLSPGDFVKVKITGSKDYDLLAALA